MADFFDKVKSGVLRGANAVADKSEQLVEITKLKAARAKMEAEMEQDFCDLGKAFYAMMEQDDLNVDALRSRCTVIGHLKAQIADNRAEEERVKGKDSRSTGEGE